MKTILSVTGTRADYGIYRPVFQAMTASPSLDLSLLVTGMHLRREFGHTVDEIEADGFPIAARIDCLTGEDSPRAMAEYIGRTLIEAAKVLEQQRPDLLFLLGDRGEQLAGAIAAVELGIPIAHLHGGEQTGTVDDTMRHAITQMATIHLTTAGLHSERVQQMKGSAENVHVVGAPALDVIRTLKAIPRDQLFTAAGFDAALPTLIFVQHPDTTDTLTPQKQLEPSLQALENFDGNIMIIGANADAGGRTMNAMLQAFAKKKTNRAFRISIPHETFLSWQACGDILVGNSSSGIIEAASFRLPVVNIGDQQRGRLRSGNVLDVPYGAAAITAAIAKAVSPAFRGSLQKIRNAYGDGHAAERIVEILAGCALPISLKP